MGVRLIGAAALAMVTAAGPASAVPGNFKAEVDRILADAWQADQPGAAVIVTEGGKTVYAAGRGLADLDARTPITADTVFRIGSIAKQFSAAVMLDLVAEGKVSLDDPLSKYLPDFPQPGASATVRQLLNHTSGIASYTGFPGWMVEANTNRPYTTEQMIDLFETLPPPSKPGEAWMYNNSGYVLVGAIIEKVTGKPWHEAIAERIAVPLGLSTLRYGVLETQTPNMAKGYEMNAEGGFKPAPKLHMSVPHAAGALIGTVEDLAAWANALHHGRALAPGIYQSMIVPAKLNDGSEHPYGFGLEMDKVRGFRTTGHGGGIHGFMTASMYIPEKDVFVAVFSNVAPPPKHSPDLVAFKLAALAVGQPFERFEKQKADLKALEPFFGVYRIAGTKAERSFFEQDGKLFTRRDGPPIEVFPAGGNRFFYDTSLSWFELKRDASGPVMEMHQPKEGAPEIARRVGPVPPPVKSAEVPRGVLENYVGSYIVGDARAVVRLDDQGLSVQLGDQPRLRLLARSQNEFEVESVSARVTFNADGDAPAKSMTLNQNGRTMEAVRARD